MVLRSRLLTEQEGLEVVNFEAPVNSALDELKNCIFCYFFIRFFVVFEIMVNNAHAMRLLSRG
jgi:hypothetical protein